MNKAIATATFAAIIGFGVAGLTAAETSAQEPQAQGDRAAVYGGEAQVAHDKAALTDAMHRLESDRAHNAPADVQEKDRNEVDRLKQAEATDSSHLKTDAERVTHDNEKAERQGAAAKVYKGEAEVAHDKTALVGAMHKLESDRAHNAPADVQEKDRYEVDRLKQAEATDSSHLGTDAERVRNEQQGK
jgi:hypothetical protein